MKNKCISYLQGDLRISVTGDSPERFLSVCAENGVVFREVYRTEDLRLEASLSAGDVSRMRAAAGKSGCHIRVIRKRGLPFLLASVFRRKALWIGALLAVACAVWLSGRVWFIHVEGCETVSQWELLEAFREAGLKTGVSRRNLPITGIKTDVITRIDKLSHLTINFKGIGAYIHVWERKETPEALDESIPCDVISGKAGVILRLRVRSGVSQVRIGDTIQAGDVLSSGTVVSALGETTQLHALAEADLRTWYTDRAAVPKEIRTASHIPGTVERSLILGERRFPWNRIEKPADPWYDMEVKKSFWRPHPDFRWPAALETRSVCPLDGSPEPLSREKAAAILEQRMLQRLLSALPDARLVHHTFTLEDKGGAYVGVLRVEMIETTGIEVPIAR